MPNFRGGNPAPKPVGGVYLRRLRYEQPYSIASSPANRYIYQDALINSTIANQDASARAGRAAASLESTVFSRYGLILKQYVDLLTGYPEYLR